MLRRIVFAALLLIASTLSSFAASQGFVVASCPGTLGVNAYTAGQFGNITLDVNGLQCIAGTITTTPATPAAGTLGAGYPAGATPIIAAATGTTGGDSATLSAAAGKFTYICGFTISPGSATAAITINLTVNGLSVTFNEWAGAPVTAAGTTGITVTRAFNPCIPGSAVNTAIVVGASALGAGGINQTIYAWGFQQ